MRENDLLFGAPDPPPRSRLHSARYYYIRNFAHRNVTIDPICARCGDNNCGTRASIYAHTLVCECLKIIRNTPSNRGHTSELGLYMYMYTYLLHPPPHTPTHVRASVAFGTSKLSAVSPFLKRNLPSSLGRTINRLIARELESSP